MRRIAFFLSVTAAASVFSFAQSTQSPGGLHSESAGFDPGRDPEKDLRAAIIEAQGAGKRILLDVGGDWCIWCHRLDKCFREHTDIARILRHDYVTVKVNYSKENRNQKFLSRFPKIEGYPHLFVLRADGTLLHSQDTGLLESGDYHDPQKVLSFLKTWSSASPHD